MNYTAHGSNTSWAGPSLTNSDVNNLTNTDKYFLAMGNCCQAADWGISGACFGETMVRAENKAAYAYIGSCPSTYWLNDYYFAVGATSRADGTMPSYEETTFGCYDAIWTDNAYNTVCAIPYIGNLAGNAAGALGYTLHVETLYCWQAYHVLGDGSVLPYRIQPVANDISHLPILPIGMDFFEVSAEPGSYVGISKDGVLYGAGTIDESGTTNIALTPITSGGDVTVCITHPNCIPSIETIPAAAMEGPFISVNSFTPGNVPCNEEQTMSITFKNVGADPTTGTTNVVLTCDDANLTIIDGEGSFGTINPDETITLTDEFSFIVAPGIADNTKITINVTSTCGSDTWAGKATVVVGAPIVNYVGFQWAGLFEPGETYPVIAKFENKGHYMANNAVVTISSASSYLSFAQPEFNVGTIEAGGEGMALFYVTIDPSCPTTEQMSLTFTLTADNGVAAEGEGVMKNTCNVVFHLHDSWGDGWNGCKLVVSFSDGTPSQDLTISSGNSADYTLEIGAGVHTTVTFQVGQYASETSFEIEYEGGEQIYASQGTPTAGVACQFDVNCGGTPVPPSQITHTKYLSGNVWYSTYIEMNGSEGLNLIKDALGSSASIIKSHNNYTSYIPGYGWFGQLDSASNEEMYIIQMSEGHETSVSGVKADPQSHPITIGNNWNWIGYISDVKMNVSEAFSGITPSDGDILKSHTQYCSFINGYGWFGQLTKMNPGDGYLYFNSSQNPQTLVYPSSAKEHVGSDKDSNNHWECDYSLYSSNMTVCAVVNINGSEVRSEEFEIGAFCNGECRGTAQALYCEFLNRYLFMPVVGGVYGDLIEFRLYDAANDIEYQNVALDAVRFEEDLSVGKVLDPFIIRFTCDDVNEAYRDKAVVFPNPTDDKLHVEAAGLKRITIYNVTGQTVCRQTADSDEMTVDMSRFGAGMYVIEIETGDGTSVRRVSVTE